MTGTRIITAAIIMVYASVTTHAQSTPKARAAAQEARAAASASGIRAAANRAAVLNARKNAATLQRRQADRLVNPPMRDYSRVDQAAVQDIVFESQALASAYGVLRAGAVANYEIWEKDNAKALAAYFESIKDLFVEPKDLKEVGDKGYMLDKEEFGTPLLSVSRIKADGKGFYNREYGLWITGVDLGNKVDGDRVDSVDYEFEVVGKARLSTLLSVISSDGENARTVRHLHATKKKMADLPDPPVTPPAPVGITEREAMLAVFPEARDLTMGGKTALCGYVRRVRVQTRKYDVYVVLLHEDALHLAWVPWVQIDKPDAIWIAKTDRARAKAAN